LEEAEQLRVRAVDLQRRQRTIGMLALEAELHRANGEHDRAIEAWQQVLALEARSATAHLRLADVLMAAKRMDEAAAQLVMAIEAKGGAEAHRRLALVYAAIGRTDDSARERRLYTEERLRELRGR
jgi:tetratricopeptide (TPR) repeat protein